MQTPLVSIIIPTYNRAHLIGETLDSVLAQTYTNWECIVVDDGSTDGTDILLAEYCENDNRFQYHHRPKDRPKGANACRNYGFELSKGEYVNWLDSDDLFSYNKIEDQLKTLIINDGDIATCKWGRFNENIQDAIIKENQAYYKNYSDSLSLFNSFAKNEGYFPSHSYLIRREIVNLTEKWNESLIINQDGEYLCRILLKCKNIIFVSTSIVYYRFNNGDNTSTFNSFKKNGAAIKSWEMINEHIKNKYGIDNSLYIKKAKELLYVKTKQKYPELIEVNKLFFKIQIQNNLPLNKLVRRVLNKLRFKNE